jgi:hypothetical protein
MELTEAVGATPQAPEKVVARERPDPAPQRAELCSKWQSRIRAAKVHWEPSFRRMREDMRFAAGYQWPDQTDNDDRYVANIVLRHIKHRTASLYARNPRTVVRRKTKLVSSLWDGTMTSLQAAQQQMASAQEIMSTVPDPVVQGHAAAVLAQAQAIVNDAQQAIQQNQMLDRIARSLELAYDYSLDEQVIPFKEGMKEVVRRTVTTGVGYTKLGFQRAMKMKPEVERQISDYSEKLATIERLSADIADGESVPDGAEAEQLRLAMNALSKEPMILAREGLDVSYPDSTALIPDPKCKRLRNWVGAGWVAEEFMLSGEDIQEIYGVDVQSAGAGARAYQKIEGPGQPVRLSEPWEDKKSSEVFCVWEVYSRKDGLVYVLCDGYPDFLREPGQPEVWIERFYPWFVLSFNDVYHTNSVFPMSDVRLIRDMQLEMNRARQGLREHRRANRPKMATANGMLDDEDKDKLRNHPANAIIELNGLQPGQSVDQLLQPIKMPPIDPSLYDVSAPFQDILRVVGAQEANLGGTSGASATETSIAESSRMSGQSSDVDDLDEMLTGMARAAGQVILLEYSQETIIQIVGPGAVWPEMNRDQAARELILDIEAASTGRPNKAAEIQNINQIAPVLLQIPGLNPEWLARQILQRMDEKLDLSEAFTAGLPSIMSMNRGGGQATGAPADKDPNAQGAEGSNNSGAEPKRNNMGADGPPPPRSAPPMMSQ